VELPKIVKEIFTKFEHSKYQIYLVGGSVRDLLLDRQVTDWDFTTDATPDEILKVFPGGHYNNKFGTVGIPYDNGIIQITTMRKEGDYQDFRHPGKVEWTKNLNEDLKRRDFTVNALAQNSRGQITDLFDGQGDLKNKIIKNVGNPADRFKEDALRLIRAVRFAAQLDFEVDQKTFSSIKENVGLIKAVAFERIRDEIFKILASKNPLKGFILLRDCGILEIVLPEVAKTFGVKQDGPKHDRKYDVGEHSFLTLKETPSTDPLVKFAALLHDIGKVKTMRVNHDGNVTFYNHEVVGSRQTKEIAKRFKLSNEQTEKLVKLIRWHLFTVDENQTDSAVRRFVKNIGVQNVEDMYHLRIGDRLGGGTQTAVSWRMEDFFKKRIPAVLTKPFSITDLKVSGKDVMNTLNIQPGPKVGKILQTLFEEVQENSDKNNRDYLLKKLTSLRNN